MKFINTAIAFVISLMLGCTYNKDQNHDTMKVLSKSGLDGEWFTRATLVAKHAHSSFGFTGMECPVERVKFEITKDQLLAFRSYDKGTSQLSKSRDQNLVAAFRITKHFDDNTGIDRPWYERDYISVDWSENLAPHVDCNQWLTAISTININNTENVDRKEPFRVRLQDGYMESTVDAIVEPDVKTCEKIGESNCQAAEYRVKFSFRKVDSDNNYEKQIYPDAEPIRFGTNDRGLCLESDEHCHDVRELWLYEDAARTTLCDPLRHNIKDCFLPMVKVNSRFGFFRTEMGIYDRKEGFTRRDRLQFINRWNLWAQNRSDGNGHVPIAMRQPKPIVYYLNPGFPHSLLPSVNLVAKEWNRAFLNVIAKIKNKCNVHDANQAIQQYGLHERLAVRGINQIDTINLQEACGIIYDATKDLTPSAIFFTGDLHEIEHAFGPMFEIRVNDCNEQNVVAFVKRNDLEWALREQGITEISDSNLEQACAVVEWASLNYSANERFSWQQLGDLRYSFVNGVNKPDADLLGYGPASVDPKSGEIIGGNANIYLSTIANYATKSAMLLAHIEQLEERLAEDHEAPSSNVDDEMANFSTYVDRAITSMTATTYKSARSPIYQTINLARALRLEGFNSITSWPIENLLGSLPNTLGRNADIHNLMSVISGQASDLGKNHQRENFFSERSACFSHASQELPYGRLTKELKNLSFPDRIEYIKARVFEAVVKHELGHTFGLRHNFKGAYDALNYPPNFWGVNTNDILMRDGLSSEELRSSSIMDYHKQFNSDFSGLGLYDYAALLSGYAGMVEVFDTKEEDFIPHSFMGRLNVMDYHDLPYLFSGGNADQVILRHYHQVRDRYLRGTASAHMQIPKLGLPSRPENFYKRRLVNYDMLKRQKLASIIGNGGHAFVEVPYAFCTDGQASGQDIACHPFIYGSSASEIIDSAIKDYELSHALNGLSGALLPKNVGAYLNHAYSRVYLPILRTYQQMYLTSDSYNKIYPAIHDIALGAKHGVDFISRVLQAVEPGTYCKDAAGNYVPRVDGEICNDSIVIDDLVGRKYRSTFGPELAASEERVGYIYDKILALLALIDDQTAIDHAFSSFSHQDYSIGFYRVFTPQLTALFSDIYAGQWQKFAPAIDVDSNHKARIHYRDAFAINRNETTLDLPKIQPSFSPALRDYAILFSMTGLSNPLDHKLDFAKKAQISVIGSGQSAFVLDGMAEIAFRDPTTGIGYRAVTRNGEDLSPGYRLLKEAQQFISDGTRAGEVPGPWYVAKQVFSEAKSRLILLRSTSASSSTEEELTRIEDEVRLAEEALLQKNRLLKDKVRVIEQVARLSKQLVD